MLFEHGGEPLETDVTRYICVMYYSSPPGLLTHTNCKSNIVDNVKTLCYIFVWLTVLLFIWEGDKNPPCPAVFLILLS